MNFGRKPLEIIDEIPKKPQPNYLQPLRKSKQNLFILEEEVYDRRIMEVESVCIVKSVKGKRKKAPAHMQEVDPSEVNMEEMLKEIEKEREEKELVKKAKKKKTKRKS